MCGIVGTAGDLALRDDNAMKRLLLLDSIRGFDSTGLASVRYGGQKVEIAKKASHCFNLFDSKSFIDTLNGNMSIALIGHNRSATSGGIKDVNAHPFQVDHITGVHNGTLEDADKSMLERMLDEKFNVDSEALFTAIARFGVKEVIPKLQKGKDSYKGAWSLVWWDAENKKLYFLRNEHRPLWYCFVEKDGKIKQIYWASEFWMLDVALAKTCSHTLWQKESTREPGKMLRFFSTEPDVLYELDIDALRKGSKERPKFHTAPLAGKEPPEVTGTVYPFSTTSREETHGNRYGNVSNDVEGESKKTSHGTPKTKSRNLREILSAKKEGKEPPVITLRGNVDMPYANYIFRAEFLSLGNTHTSVSEDPCCNWCRRQVPYGTSGVTVIFRDNIILCPDCSGNDWVPVTSDYAPANRFVVTRAMFNQVR